MADNELRVDQIDHTHGDTVLQGLLVSGQDAEGPQPTVIVFPAYDGRTDEVLAVANQIAGLGYAGFAADVYGGAATGSTPEECMALMGPWVSDRKSLEERLLEVVNSVAALDAVDESRVYAIGYCFGGLCVLDLARLNANVVGVASFHGIFTPPGTDPGGGADIEPSVLVLHGWDDPLAPPDAVTALGQELTDRNAEWQLHGFGATMHAFTNKGANDPASGVMYDERAARRSWRLFTDHLAEVVPV